ncbi:isopentenyl transferase family protein [Nocardia sp. NPDC051570]|uniref:isopentenyl transferase family protein n=1 Tax=Nocardia sp. NPDC051570 TaxID=3364324 RepID=UPI0037BE0B19
MRVHLVLGATGSGKTALATEAARRSDVPVVVLDRLQCFTDIPTASARPAEDQIAGTSRIYLDERTIPDGDYPAEDAYAALVRVLNGLAVHHDFVFAEGGSISLLSLLRRDRRGLGFPLDVTMLSPPAASLDTVARRVAAALNGRADRTSILDEMRCAWRHTEQHDFIGSISGFDALLEWCAGADIDPASLYQSSLTPSARRALTRVLVRRVHAHTARQLRALNTIGPALESTSGRTSRDTCCEVIDEIVAGRAHA